MNRKSNLFKQKSDTVYSAKGSVISISRADVDFLKGVATDEKTARVLLHGEPDAALHEMLITHSFEQYIRPHINEQSAKSFLVFEGEMVVVIYEESGAIRDHFRLCAFQSGSPFFIRLNQPVYHTVVALTNQVAFLETVIGPHTETRYATYAPSPDDVLEARKYVAWLMEELGINQ